MKCRENIFALPELMVHPSYFESDLFSLDIGVRLRKKETSNGIPTKML